MVTALMWMQLYGAPLSTGMTLSHTLIYVLVFPCVLLPSPLHLPLLLRPPLQHPLTLDLFPSSPSSELKGFCFFFRCPFFDVYVFFVSQPWSPSPPPPHPFSISTASVINNASQCIKNISRVLSSVKEREEVREKGGRTTNSILNKC